jgi:hypothetical protein
MTNNFKASAKVYSENNYSEFSTVFRVAHKQWDSSVKCDTIAYNEVFAAWADTCILALEMRMDSCVSMLFRNKDRIVSADSVGVTFVTNNGVCHTFGHGSFRVMEEMISIIDSGDLEAFTNNKAGLKQLLKALYWLPAEERVEKGRISFGTLISFILDFLD